MTIIKWVINTWMLKVIVSLKTMNDAHAVIARGQTLLVSMVCPNLGPHLAPIHSIRKLSWVKVINSLKISTCAPGVVGTKWSCVISTAKCQSECTFVKTLFFTGWYSRIDTQLLMYRGGCKYLNFAPFFVWKVGWHHCLHFWFLTLLLYLNKFQQKWPQKKISEIWFWVLFVRGNLRPWSRSCSWGLWAGQRSLGL